jgi:hypothetical protein
MNTTTDFSRFGWRERELAADLLKALCEKGFPDDFDDDGVTIVFNANSGNVFFTNESYQVCMMNGDDLESFYSCPICGHEGFLDEMDHGEDDEDCQEYLKDTWSKAYGEEKMSDLKRRSRR